MRNKIFRFTIAAAVTAVSLFYAFRRVDMEAVWTALLKANYVWMFAALAVMYASHWARAERWRVMLRSVKKVGAGHAFSAVMIGYALNQITPRGGELLRPYILGRRERISKSLLLATIVIERSFDMATLVAIVIVSAVVLGAQFGGTIAALFRQNEWTKSMGVAGAGDLLRLIALPFSIALIALVWILFSHTGNRLLGRAVLLLPRSRQEFLRGLLASFREGMRVVRSGGQFTLALAYTACIWLGYLLMLYFPLFAFHLQAQLTFGDMFIILALVSIAMTIAPTPGGMGVYHFFCIQGMALLFNVDYKTGAAFATLTHGFGYIFMLLTGAAFYLHEHITWDDVKTAERTKS